MIRQAVILEAGLSSMLNVNTLGPLNGFLEFDGVSIIEASIRKLISSGVEEIIIGTGYHSEIYEELTKKYNCITLVKNENYRDAGSMGTLACCLTKIKYDFLLLESDLIYDSIGLFVLINDPHPNVILASGNTDSGNEIFLEINSDYNLIKHSKKKEELGIIYGELVGISKLTKSTVESMVVFMNDSLSAKPIIDYEEAMSHVSSSSNPIAVRKIEHYVWCRINDDMQLKTATEHIYPWIKENEELRNVKREILLNPGPATTTDGVKYAQVQADICPREHEFGDIMEWVANELSLLAGKPGRVKTVLFGGSGTAGDEAMISSCIPPEGKLLIVNNGAYGKRMAKIASVYRIDFDVYESDGINTPDIDEMKKLLDSEKYTHFFMVYHETTTGLLNPVPEMCRYCHSKGITTIIDAVSAFSAIPIDMDRDCIDFMASTSNKNIQGMAGLTFVFCRTEALEAIKDYPMKNYYLNVYDQYAYFEKTHQTRFTPPVQTFYSLRQAIIETKLETIERRYDRYTACWKILIEGLKRLGLKNLVPEEAQSHMIVTIYNPESPKYDFDTLHDLAKSMGFTIYPGKLSDHPTFRIANIGDIRPEEMEKFVNLLDIYITRLEEHDSNNTS